MLPTELMTQRIQSLNPLFIVGHDSFERSPKLARMIVLKHVAGFVCQNIVNKVGWRHHEAPI